MPCSGFDATSDTELHTLYIKHAPTTINL